jgi:hypothetical protein
MAKEQVKVTGWQWTKETVPDSESQVLTVTLTVEVLGQLGRYHKRTVELPAALLVEFLSLITPIETSQEHPPSPEETGSDDSADSEAPH